MAEPSDAPNPIAAILSDAAQFLGLLAKVASDDATSEEVFGFSLDVGAFSQLTVIADSLHELAQGKADLAAYAAGAERLAELTNVVQSGTELISSSLPPGMIAAEVVGTVVDTVALSYLFGRYPAVTRVFRALGMFDENVPFDPATQAETGVAGAFWRLFSVRPRADALGIRALLALENEADAREATIVLAGLAAALAVFTPFVDFTHNAADPNRFQVVQGFEADPGSTTPLADRVSQRFITVVLRLPVADAPAPTEFEIKLTLALVPRSHGGPGLFLSIGSAAGVDVDLGNGWHLIWEMDIENGVEAFFGWKDSDTESFVSLGDSIGTSAAMRIERRDQTTSPAPPKALRIGEVIEVQSLSFGIRIDSTTSTGAVLEASLRLHGLSLTLARPERGFLRHVIPASGIHAEFELGVIAGIVDTKPSLRLEGGSGLEVSIPIRTSGPGLQGLQVYLALRPRSETAPEDAPAATFEASVGFAVRIGAFSATVDGFGIILPRAPFGPPGARWIKFPNAIGIGIDGDIVSGGGFILFDPERGRYAGALSLKIGRFALEAYGLLTDLNDGYSLLVVLSLQFHPGLTGPFGISLTGIGGIFGHNHGANVAALQASVRTGAVGLVMFPDDPVAAAPRVLTTLATLFPVQRDSSLIGIGIKLERRPITATLVVIVERGSASRVIVLASVALTIPSSGTPRIRIRVDGVGIFDRSRRSLEIDASLVDSIVGPWKVTGDAALRSRGGDDALFVLSVGGFHPRFTPPANANLPPLRRVAFALPSDNPRVRIEFYAAVTSNSVQFGARLELSARKGGFAAEAVLAFDVLIGGDSGGFEVSIEGRAAIRYDGTTLASVSLHLKVTGPGHWTIDGKATLSLFFFSIGIPIHYETGNPDTAEIVQQLDAAQLLSAAIADPSSWETTQPLGSAAMVAFRAPSQAGTVAEALAAHPAGRLSMRQSVLPFGLEIRHLGRAGVTPDTFRVASVAVNGTAIDHANATGTFAAGEFLDLSDDERLSRPAFESFSAGFSSVVGDLVAGPGEPVEFSYEQVVIGPDGPVGPTRPAPALTAVVMFATKSGAAATSVLRAADRVAAYRANGLVAVAPARSLVVDAATLRPAESGARRVGFADSIARQHAGRRRGDGIQFVVIAEHEAVVT